MFYRQLYLSKLMKDPYNRCHSTFAFKILKWRRLMSLWKVCGEMMKHYEFSCCFRSEQNSRDRDYVNVPVFQYLKLPCRQFDRKRKSEKQERFKSIQSTSWVCLNRWNVLVKTLQTWEISGSEWSPRFDWENTLKRAPQHLENIMLQHSL